MFQLNADEKSEVVAKCDHLEKLKFSKVLPYAFTEHGAIMAASVLNSPQATEVSIFIVRAFVKLRQTISEHKELNRKISQIERHLSGHDEQITVIIKTIKQLIQPSEVLNLVYLLPAFVFLSSKSCISKFFFIFLLI